MLRTIKRYIARYPRVKTALIRLRKIFKKQDSVSYGYISLFGDQAICEGNRLRYSWQDQSLPSRQRMVVDTQLAQYRRGENVLEFDVFIRSLRELPSEIEGFSLLEIGCSSGYYAEVLQIAGIQVHYFGCDYAPHFINMAREKYPWINFLINDATKLQYKNSQFDIVVSGGCLLHIPNYALAVAETVRVSKQYVIFHRTPVVCGRPEQWYSKKAYGVNTIEIHFNEDEFLKLLKINGLELVNTYTLSEEIDTVESSLSHAVRTYVFKKKAQ